MLRTTARSSPRKRRTAPEAPPSSIAICSEAMLKTVSSGAARATCTARRCSAASSSARSTSGPAAIAMEGVSQLRATVLRLEPPSGRYDHFQQQRLGPLAEARQDLVERREQRLVVGDRPRRAAEAARDGGDVDGVEGGPRAGVAGHLGQLVHDRVAAVG